MANLPSNMVEIALSPELAYDRTGTTDCTIFMCKYEVTQVLWREIMGENPLPSKGKEPSLPVMGVLWDDCKTFVEKLNERPEVKASRLVYQLPSADVWNYYAYCGGTPTKEYKYGCHADGAVATMATLQRMEWFKFRR